MKDPHLKWYGLHHGWIGLGINGVGFLVVFFHPFWAWVLFAIGGYLMLDDMMQHTRQRTQPGYRSPVNKLWGVIVRKWRER
jgi:hypothetical protein